MATQLDVLSPLAVSMRLAAYQPTIEFMAAAGQIMALPPQVDLFADRIRLLEDMSYDTGMRPEHQVDEEERKAKLAAHGWARPRPSWRRPRPTPRHLNRPRGNPCMSNPFIAPRKLQSFEALQATP